jgi:hypothetical protein
MGSGLVTNNAIVNAINTRLRIIGNGLYRLNLEQTIGRSAYYLDVISTDGDFITSICSGTLAECEAMAKAYESNIVKSFYNAYQEFLPK